MRTIDIVAFILLAVGGLNWGLVGAANFDLVATLFGDGTFFARLAYGLVGLSALYLILSSSIIPRRWAAARA